MNMLDNNNSKYKSQKTKYLKKLYQCYTNINLLWNVGYRMKLEQ